jgi:hypothetical protein
MFATARALAAGHARARAGRPLSEAELNVAVFEQIFGRDFDDATRHAIGDRIRAAAGGG